MQFRSKPVEPTRVEAVQFTGKNVDELVAFVGERGCTVADGFNPGDWVVKNTDGPCHLMQREIFAATYEPVTEAS